MVKYKRQKHGLVKEICYKNMNEIAELLEKNNIFFWLSEGTALGVFRDGDLIAHDDDVDFGFYGDQISIFENKVIPELEKKGYIIDNVVNGYFAMKDEHFIDFDIVYKDSVCYAKYFDPCKDLLPHITNFYKIYWNNRFWNVPKESYYEYLYGKTWMIPIKNKKPNIIN